MWVKAKQSSVFLLAFLIVFNMDYFFTHLNRAKANERTRTARFAGSWYPDKADSLDKMLNKQLQEAKAKLAVLPANERPGKNILAIIAPHAGYVYSGQTAAFAYAALSNTKCKRLFLLGPSHHIGFNGAVVPSQCILETPIGNLDIDRDAVDKLLSSPGFQQVDQVFDVEHSLELQLPWILKTQGRVKVVPLAIGSLNSDTAKEIASGLRNELQPGDVVIISSDFTHYGPRFDYQPFGEQSTNSQVKEKIAALDKEAFNYLKKLDSTELLEFYQRSHDTICGIYPCAILLSLLPHSAGATLLRYSTSADVEKEDLDNSVSYMAIAFSGTGWAVTNKSAISAKGIKSELLSNTDGETLLKIARQAIQDHLSGAGKNAEEYTKGLASEQITRFREERGVFVTLYEKSSQTLSSPQESGQPHKQLRGCIGYIYPVKSLLAAVCENAINAATIDPRFPPVGVEELDKLDIEINVLSKPSPILSWQDIELGKDGVVLKKGDRQAVFLPKVATEFGWNLQETLGQLSLKAGLPADGWRQGTQLEVFQSQVFQ
jgi:AmmeMemoRadiSam system protein B/AmmeMemoRadiSam system protein A